VGERVIAAQREAAADRKASMVRPNSCAVQRACEPCILVQMPTELQGRQAVHGCYTSG